MSPHKEKDTVKPSPTSADDEIPVACASDHRYLCGLLTTLWSLCENASDRSRLRLHILDIGLLARDREALRRMLAASGISEAQFSFHTVPAEQFAHLPQWRGSWGAYARLILPDLLPNNDFAIYTDIDTLWLRDVVELWALRERRPALWAVPDGSGLANLSGGSKRQADLQVLGTTIQPREYFCSGLLMMNLHRLRQEGFVKRAQAFLAEHINRLDLPDQDLYNCFYPAPETVLLDWRWGEFSTAYGQRDCLAPRVIHYAHAAPWNHVPSRAGGLWFRAYACACRAAGLGWRARYAKLRTLQHALLGTRCGFYLLRWPLLVINRKLFAKRFRAFFPTPLP